MRGNPSIMRAEDFLHFLDASPTPFHAVHTAKQRLEKASFRQIKECNPWSSVLKPGGRYYLTRNTTTIVAFAIGQDWKPGNPVSIIGAHTDSPCLRIKPISKRNSEGFTQVAVETYGAGMWHTWFDRDLGVAGRLLVKDNNGHVRQNLVKISKPICRIPSLAAHFGGSAPFGQNLPFEFNKETHLLPITGLVSAEINRADVIDEKSQEKESQIEKTFTPEPLITPTERHHSYLIALLAENAGIEPSAIVDFECVLFDTQPACIGGLNDEFVFSGRLDNLGMTYCAIEGLIQSLEPSSALNADNTVRMIACFDHEEIGSTSAQGAGSNILPSVLRRLSHMSSLSSAICTPSDAQTTGEGGIMQDDATTAYEQTLARSFLISADMAHSMNPNYANNYESEHRPLMNAGTVIKVNACVRYATNSPGIVLLQECARRAKPASFPSYRVQADDKRTGVPLQLFVVRNDSRCGSTIGPMLSAALGVRAIDVGNAQLSMHSIRETSGSHDIEHSVHLFESFFTHFGDLENKILID